MKGVLTMSKYTTEVRFICETYAGLNESAGFGSVKEVIEKARGKIFDFEYPIFDEKYRGVLETKILKHYYTREIGAETVGLWKLWLDTKLNEIMPYYNKLYESELLVFNPFYDVDMTREYSVEKNGEKTDVNEAKDETKSKGNRNSQTNDKRTDSSVTKDENSLQHNDYYSDTPQGSVGNLSDLSYLTNARQVADNGTNNTTSSGTNEGTTQFNENSTADAERTSNSNNNTTFNDTEKYLEHVKGKQSGANYSRLLAEYRQTFLNIDMMIVDELANLFMGLW